MPPEQNDHQYDFITEGKKSDTGFLTAASTGQRIVMVSVGLLVLIIIFMFLSSFLSRGGEDHRNNLINIAQAQTEIIRVAKLGEREASRVDNKLQAEMIIIYQTVQSDLNETNMLLDNAGIQVSNRVLAGMQDEQRDELIDQAIANNQLPEVLSEIMETQLREYQHILQQAYGTGSQDEREIFEKNFDDINILLDNAEQ